VEGRIGRAGANWVMLELVFCLIPYTLW
jgi:hypothetical protein